MQTSANALQATRKAFATVVRKERRARALSQEDFAELCDLHRNDIGRIERAEINVSFDNIARIAAGIGVKISTLLDRAGL